MNNSGFILPAVLFLATLAAGFWVSRSGKPYHTGIFTLHKLAALATVVLTVITLTKLFKVMPDQSITILMIIIAGLSVIALFATGALMSIEKNLNKAWVWVHRAGVLLLAASGMSLIILVINQR